MSLQRGGKQLFDGYLPSQDSAYLPAFTRMSFIPSSLEQGLFVRKMYELTMVIDRIRAYVRRLTPSDRVHLTN
jgi:hypothetical protein